VAAGRPTAGRNPPGSASKTLPRKSGQNSPEREFRA